MGTDPKIIEAELAASKANLLQDLRHLEEGIALRLRELSAPRVLERLIEKHPVESVALASVAGFVLGVYGSDKKRIESLGKNFDQLKDVALTAIVEVATAKLVEALPSIHADSVAETR